MTCNNIESQMGRLTIPALCF